MTARILRPISLALALSACGPTYVTNTRIPYTAEKQNLADLTERYREALEQRDVDTLRSLASRDYYENGSTTDDPKDDYGSEGLDKVLADLKSSVPAAKVEFELTNIEVIGDVALVDLNFTSHFLFKVTGDEQKWETAGDKNRLTFKREDGRWRIVSGL